MKYVLITTIALVVAGIAAFVLFSPPQADVRFDRVPAGDSAEPSEDTSPVAEELSTTTDAQETEAEVSFAGERIIGTSAGGNDIVAHRFGSGDTHLMFVGGIHGGYSWNTIVLAREIVDYFSERADRIPENVRVTVIPLLNPDGLAAVAGTTGAFTADDIPDAQSETVPGRFNAHGVDLNRNFDCEWQTTGTWQNREVSGGDAPFSEPEAAAVRDYISEYEPDAVVIYYSAAGGVFASNCRNGVSDDTRTLMNTYAEAAGYQAFDSYDFYEITGDMANWLAAEDVPAISVLLSSHETVEWSKNRAGIDAMLEAYAE